ncbi:Universal stress protein UspA-related nucleotide-binding protein (plasmid) [Rubrobacter radiotolerans]|uniref:Universal stress protein n=1 Tax=Rubrobacter radiotolerans TaxID=42256 RepID=A0A023X835_RUBRA|nr:universal stress protein [Rubrobacter radiotolerans]AHY48381.1 Universal stress protein UspA-related nucleotide-binding protein [Rubrobacter radiotolerans]MDX5895517.1 universal stress protein [Rubrobacter radiotolerans]SMC01586.1 Nucleotide-binding universal stress protein, UspA family [Rubrobacter radiotolerans DSM 5868]
MKKIMVAWDGSETAARAFEKAAEISSKFEAELHVVSVAQVPDYAETTEEYQGALEDAERFFERKGAMLEEAARKYGVEYERKIIHGHPSRTLIEYAERGEFDLMVVGRKGRSALERFMVGSVTRRLAIYAPCPVLIVPKSGTRAW